MKIFCIIPAYNEEKTISKVIKEVKNYIENIIIVDDGSSDNTHELAKKENVTVLKHIINRGQGASLQTGNDYALINNADIIVHFDADGQFSPKEIKDIINPLIRRDADIVFGSRFLGKKSNMPKFKKYLIIPLAHLFNKIIIGKTLSDPQSGFRALSKKAAKKIKIENDGMAHCSEIIHKSFKNKLNIKEVPITVFYNEFGQHFGGGIKIIKDIFLSKLIQ